MERVADSEWAKRRENIDKEAGVMPCSAQGGRLASIGRAMGSHYRAFMGGRESGKAPNYQSIVNDNSRNLFYLFICYPSLYIMLGNNINPQITVHFKKRMVLNIHRKITRV